MPWPACASARSSTGSPTTPRRGGCWATSRTKAAGPGRSPFASSRTGLVNHPIFGWVPSDWVPHLERGELPAPSVRVQDKVRWLPAAEADRLRANWNNPWKITTEHFEIQTDVPLAEAIALRAAARGVLRPLLRAAWPTWSARTCPWPGGSAHPSLTAEAAYRPHQVYYFATKEEYVEHLRASVGVGHRPEPGLLQPAPGRPGQPRPRPTSSATPAASSPSRRRSTTRSRTSSSSRRPDPTPTRRTRATTGSSRGWDLLRDRLAPARRLARGRRPRRRADRGGTSGRSRTAGSCPCEPFVRLDQNGFNRADRIYVHYQQAMALTVFLMQYDDAAYRDAFLDYVRDAYRGRIKTGYRPIAGRPARPTARRARGPVPAIPHRRRIPSAPLRIDDTLTGGGSACSARSAISTAVC